MISSPIGVNCLKNQGESTQIVENIIKQYSSSSEQFYVNSLDNEKSFVANETFVFETNASITKVAKEGGPEIVDYRFMDNKVYIELENFVDLDYIKISFYNSSELIDTCSLYFAKGSDGLFYSSSISLDAARRNAGQTLNYSFVSSDESDEYSIKKSLGASTNSIGATGKVSGTLRWTDEQGNTHPLIGAKIKVTMAGSWWSCETYTNITGYYAVPYEGIWYLGSGKPMIHIYTECENVKVICDNTYEHTYEFSSPSGGTYSYVFSPSVDGDMGKAMMIVQGAKNFSDYAEKLNGGVAIDFCTLKYPTDLSSGAYYSNGTIYISSSEPKYSYLPQYYASWDIIGHEYGHHVQRIFGFSESKGGKHYIDSNNIDDQYESGYSLEESKDRGYKLSWGEAWSTYWSIVAQKQFSDDLKSIKTVGDNNYTASNGPDYSLDSYSGGYGDADEVAIQRILYKLYSNSTDEYDVFSLGDETLWDVVIENKPVTFYEFINDLYYDGYNKSNLGKLLAKYNVVAGSISVTNNYFDTLPTFSWSTYMGSDNLRFNSFDLYFESSTGSTIKNIMGISASGKTRAYSLNSSLWQAIYDSPGTYFYVYLVARQTDYFSSGNYYSEKFLFNKPTTFSSTKIQVKPNEWGFIGRYYFPNEIEKDTSVRYSTFTKAGLTISTDRLRCGYIEKSYVNLSPRREDAGRSYLQLEFDKPVYSFMYSICLWSKKENLDGLAVLQTKDVNGNWTILTDLKNDISLTYRNDGGLKRYSHYFSSGIYGIKFESTATATGTENRGRLCIDDIVFSTTSGYSNNQYYIKNYAKTSA